MGFTEAVSTCFSKYATFSGRASRSEYWYFSLFGFLICLIIGLIPIIGVLIDFIILLIILLPSLAAFSRRMHDINKSGWWFLLYFTGIGGIILFIFLVTEGDKGDNNYGPNPLLAHGSQSQQSRRPQQATSQRPQQRQQSRPNPQPRPQTAYDYSVPRGGAAAASRFASEETEIVGGGYDRASNAVARLTVNGRQYTLRSGRNIIGRQGDTSEATVQIVTNDMYMSRQHCVITVIPQSDGRVSAKISNYQNKNKTMINGRILDSMKEVWLPNVCDITMGHTTVRYNA